MNRTHSTKINNFISLLLLITLGTMLASSCKTTGLTGEEKVKQFGNMTWLIGRWQNPGNETALNEEWEKVNDTLFKGTSLMMLGDDTLYSEELKIAPAGINIFYSIISHNEQNTVRSSYVLLKNRGGKMVFEDQANREQFRLTYIKKSDASIVLKLEGMDGEKASVEVYNLKKVDNQ
jgi:hypothetical protein